MPPANLNRLRADPDDSQAHVHRRKTDSDSVLQLHDRINDHDRRLDGHDKIIDSFSGRIDALNHNMGRLADWFERLDNFDGFWATLKMLSAGSKILLTLAAGGAALWAAFKFLIWLSANGV